MLTVDWYYGFLGDFVESTKDNYNSFKGLKLRLYNYFYQISFGPLGNRKIRKPWWERS